MRCRDLEVSRGAGQVSVHQLTSAALGNDSVTLCEIPYLFGIASVLDEASVKVCVTAECSCGCLVAFCQAADGKEMRPVLTHS